MAALCQQEMLTRCISGPLYLLSTHHASSPTYKVMNNMARRMLSPTYSIGRKSILVTLFTAAQRDSALRQGRLQCYILHRNHLFLASGSCCFEQKWICNILHLKLPINLKFRWCSKNQGHTCTVLLAQGQSTLDPDL